VEVVGDEVAAATFAEAVGAVNSVVAGPLLAVEDNVHNAVADGGGGVEDVVMNVVVEAQGHLIY
jgi:hypothetical protein